MNDYIEVKKKYLTKLEEESKELDVYKKAFKLACDEIRDSECVHYHLTGICKLNCDLCDVCDGNIELEEHYLQKAREQK